VDKLFAAARYLKYFLEAGNAHDIHSPFVFELYNNVILDNTPYYGFDLIESVRAKLLLNYEKINIIDFGTGKNREERISKLVNKSVKSKKYAQLLFRLSNRFSPQNILELGTSAGITTIYLAMPHKDNQIITLEGSPEIAALARKNFLLLKKNNIEILCGEFSESLPLALNKLKHLDFVYFDGNHKYEPTMNYFQECLKLSNENSVFIFDDIHWSREMENAWKEIKMNDQVTITIDLFQVGLVFLKKGLTKQHFVLRF
jgi:predicted O-methyltransferase YrrM